MRWASPLQQTLIGDHGAGVDVHPDKIRAGGRGYAHRGVRVVAQQVDADRQRMARLDVRRQHRDQRDDVRVHRPRREWRIPEVFEDDAVEACVRQHLRVMQRTGAHRRKTRRAVGPARQRQQVRDPNEGKVCVQRAHPFFRSNSFMKSTSTATLSMGSAL